MSFPSESDTMSKELQNSDLIYVNLMTMFLKLSPNIAIYRLVGTELIRGPISHLFQKKIVIVITTVTHSDVNHFLYEILGLLFVCLRKKMERLGSVCLV